MSSRATAATLPIPDDKAAQAQDSDGSSARTRHMCREPTRGVRRRRGKRDAEWSECSGKRAGRGRPGLLVAPLLDEDWDQGRDTSSESNS